MDKPAEICYDKTRVPAADTAGSTNEERGVIQEMFTTTYDWIFALICGVLAVVFFLGKGQGVLRAFMSRDQRGKKSKRTPEEENAYQRAIGIFLLVLAACSVLMATLGSKYAWVSWIEIAVVVIGLIVIVKYLKKNFPE